MRRALIWSVVWVVVCLAVNVAVLLLVVKFGIGGPMTSERASSFGTGIGVVTAMGLLPIWWINYIGPLRMRRDAEAREARKNRKPTKREKRKR